MQGRLRSLLGACCCGSIEREKLPGALHWAATCIETVQEKEKQPAVAAAVVVGWCNWLRG